MSEYQETSDNSADWMLPEVVDREQGQVETCDIVGEKIDCLTRNPVRHREFCQWKDLRVDQRATRTLQLNWFDVDIELVRIVEKDLEKLRQNKSCCYHEGVTLRVIVGIISEESNHKSQYGWSRKSNMNVSDEEKFIWISWTLTCKRVHKLWRESRWEIFSVHRTLWSIEQEKVFSCSFLHSKFY